MTAMHDFESNHVKFARFVLLAVIEEANNMNTLFRSMYNIISLNNIDRHEGKKNEPIAWVFGNTKTGGFIFREQGILLNCFRGKKEILIIVCGGQGITNPLSINRSIVFSTLLK